MSICSITLVRYVKNLVVTSTGLHHQYIGLNFPGFVSSLIGHVYLEKGLTQKSFWSNEQGGEPRATKGFLSSDLMMDY